MKALKAYPPRARLQPVSRDPRHPLGSGLAGCSALVWVLFVLLVQTFMLPIVSHCLSAHRSSGNKQRTVPGWRPWTAATPLSLPHPHDALPVHAGEASGTGSARAVDRG